MNRDDGELDERDDDTAGDTEPPPQRTRRIIEGAARDHGGTVAYWARVMAASIVAAFPPEGNA